MRGGAHKFMVPTPHVVCRHVVYKSSLPYVLLAPDRLVGLPLLARYQEPSRSIYLTNPHLGLSPWKR